MNESEIIGLGTIIIFVGMLVIVIGTFLGNRDNVKVSVVGFLGFIPFGFSNDRRLHVISLVVMIIFLVIFMLNKRFI